MNQERKRVSVPQNEYDAALSTLTNILNTNDSSSPSYQHQQHSSPHKQQIQSSIQNTIQQTIQPIPTAEYENMQIFGSTPIKQQLHKAIQDDDDVSVSSCSTTGLEQEEEDCNVNSKDNESDFELEQDELLDEEVYRKAQEMRQKVRLASSNLQRVREEKIQMALTGVLSEVDDFIRFEKEFEDNIQLQLQDGANDDCENRNEVHLNLSDMEEALRNLKGRLEKLDGLLPEKLQGIRDTIESVSHSLRKKMNKEYSATEKAILSRESDDVWRRNFSFGNNNYTSAVGSQEAPDDGSNGNNGVNMDAARRFAMFVSHA
jgi:hypothetical protein